MRAKGVRLTKEQGKSFREQWRIVAAAGRDELQKTSFEDKFRQLTTLVASARSFGTDNARAQEDEGARRRWNQLRQRLHA